MTNQVNYSEYVHTKGATVFAFTLEDLTSGCDQNRCNRHTEIAVTARIRFVVVRSLRKAFTPEQKKEGEGIEVTKRGT